MQTSDKYFKKTITPRMKDKTGLVLKDNPSDKVYTPIEIAKQVCDIFIKKGIFENKKILEPCLGSGSFYNYLKDKNYDIDYCEIDLGIDFFDYKDKVDVIITNPPYSCYNEFLQHSFEIATDVIFLAPLTKLNSSFGRIKEIANWGGVKYIWITTASKCGFPFGFPVGVVHYKKSYKGRIQIELAE